MNCTMESKQRESVVGAAVSYVEAMAGRLYEASTKASPGLEEMQKAASAALQGSARVMAREDDLRRCALTTRLFDQRLQQHNLDDVTTPSVRFRTGEQRTKHVRCF